MYFDPGCHYYSHLRQIAVLLVLRTFIIEPLEICLKANDSLRQTELQRIQVGLYNVQHYLHYWAHKLCFQGENDPERHTI